MALHSRKQFAELIGLEFNKNTSATIAMWVKRNKIILSGEYVDDTIPQNQLWIQKQLQKAAKEESAANTPLAELSTSVIPISEPSVERFQKKLKAVAVPDQEKLQGIKLEQALKQKSLEKLTVDTRLQELKEQKIKGEVVPMDLMKQLFASHSQSILTANKEGIEELLIDFQQEVRLSGEQAAKLRGRMFKILNNSVEKAITLTQRNMKTLVEQFSIKKEVGEHE